VAGVPIAIGVFAYLREIVDLGAWGRMNPLGGVAARLMDQVETQIYSGQQQIESVAADPALSDPATARDALRQYEPYIRSGRFKALAVELPGGGRFTVPDVLPEGLEGGWPRGGGAGISELLPGPDGGHLLAITALLTGPKAPGGRLVGLFDVSRVLGASMVDRMRVARWGEAFIADGEGRIFVSANPSLKGRTLADLDLAREPGEDGLYTADGWQGPDGTPHFVALAGSHNYYQGPQNAWRVGLIVPEAVVGQRSRGLKVWIVVIICTVLVISAGLALVLRHSMRGAPR
jgi:hypothetical protein